MKHYYPGGMPQPGRQFNTGDYRYGFNGMEQDDEVKGSGNSLDFGARVYDPRLSRWLSMDPQKEKYPDTSPYAAFGLNPIYYIVPGGETLRVAGRNHEMLVIAVQDLLSVAGEHSALFKFDAGMLQTELTLAQAEATGDPGVLLLYNLVNSERTYKYEVNTTVEYRVKNQYVKDGEYFLGAKPVKEYRGAEAITHDGIENLSTTPFGDIEFRGRILKNKTSNIPIEDDLDGHVVIGPGGFLELDGSSKPRASVVLHELLENYSRTEEGNQYMDAHQSAIETEVNMKKDNPDDPRVSDTPGKGKKN